MRCRKGVASRHRKRRCARHEYKLERCQQYARGSRTPRDGPTGFRAKPNGNMPREAEPRRSIGGRAVAARHGQLQNCTDVAAADQPVRVASQTQSIWAVRYGRWCRSVGEDCWHKNYQGAPVDGSPWVGGDCTSHVIRSGSWKNDAAMCGRRIATVTILTFDTRPMGFRIALSPRAQRSVLQ